MAHVKRVASYQEQQPAAVAPAAKKPPSDLEDGSVDFFVWLLTNDFKIDKPDVGQKYAQKLEDEDFTQEMFDEISAEELEQLGFSKGHAKRITSYHEKRKAGDSGPSTLMRSASEAKMLATDFQNQPPEVRKQEVAAALQEQKPDHWTLGEPLGKGGQGLVFRASSEGGTVHQAVKVVPFSDAETQKKLEREAAFLEKSSDENVISCLRHWSHSFDASKECASTPALSSCSTLWL